LSAIRRGRRAYERDWYAGGANFDLRWRVLVPTTATAGHAHRSQRSAGKHERQLGPGAGEDHIPCEERERCPSAAFYNLRLADGIQSRARRFRPDRCHFQLGLRLRCNETVALLLGDLELRGLTWVGSLDVR